MAREDDDFEARRKRREAEDQKEREDAMPRKKTGIAIGKPGQPQEEGVVGKLTELFDRVEPLVEQLNNLYNQYLAGVERRPPIERRKTLDSLMATLQAMGKPTQSARFRYSTLNASYLTHRDRWDRLCKEMETGKRGKR